MTLLLVFLIVGVCGGGGVVLGLPIDCLGAAV